MAPPLSSPDKNPWEKFAQENAEYYILTHENVDFRTEEGKKYFFETGEKDTSALLKNVLPILLRRKKALEIGAGIGRLAFAHAKLFEEVTAVDISHTMLAKLRQVAIRNGIKNVRTFHADAPWQIEGPYDYIYSYIVFQHIADFASIQGYVERISKSLAPEGIAQLHFDTRPISPGYLVRNVIPDMVLPKSQRKSIRRTRRKSGELRELLGLSGLQIVNELNPDSENHLFLLRVNMG
jgi:SAM-dependent methyltransferase